MTNDAPDPNSTDLLRAAFGPRARDLASINDAPRLAEHEKWERDVSNFEFLQADNALFLSPALYVGALVLQRPGLTVLALGLWAFFTVLWTPWIILRVDQRLPPGDTAKAAAFLGFALLGWPVAAAVALLWPPGAAFDAFPIVYLWAVAFGGYGAWERAADLRPTRRRAALLTGGAISYLGAALLLAALGAWCLRPTSNPLDRAPTLVIVAVFSLALLAALPGMCLVPVAWKTWRRAA